MLQKMKIHENENLSNGPTVGCFCSNAKDSAEKIFKYTSQTLNTDRWTDNSIY